MAQEATDAVKQSEVQLGKFQAGLLGFAKSLSSCYTEYDSAHAVVRDLRSKVARNTALYRELHLKVMQAVSCL